MSRKINISVRNFSEPIILIRYKSEILNGVESLVKKATINLYASVMHLNNLNSSDGERNINFEVSIVIPQPPFQLNNLSDKIIINNQQFIISKVEFNFLWKGTIKIIGIYEKDYLINDDDGLEKEMSAINNG